MTALSLEDIGWNSFFQAQLAPLAGEYQLDAAADNPARVAPYRVVIRVYLAVDFYRRDGVTK